MPNLLPLSLSDRILQSYLATLANPATSRPGAQAPGLLVCWPQARMNRYQDLLYSSAAEFGFEILPISRLEQLEEISWPGRVVFHAHWFASLHNGLLSDEEAQAATAEAFDRMARFRGRTGARLLWSAHNLFPHINRFPAASLELRCRTMQTFDMVHLLAAEHLSVLTEAYGIGPKQSFVAPHMTYDGVYPNFLNRERARAQLGILGDPFVFSFFGSIQPYKGLDNLVASFDRLLASGRDDAQLLIAGMPTDPGAVDTLRQLGGDRRVIINARRIPDIDVQLYLNSADIMVMPYADTLNSGAAALAVTFGKRLIAPRTHAFLGLGERAVGFYEPDEFDGLFRQMIACYDRRGDAEACRAAAAATLKPIKVSRRFFRGVEAGFAQR